MAISDYEYLTALIKSYEEDDSAAVTENLDTLVTLAEHRIFMGGGRLGDPFYTEPLRVKAMERSVVIPIGPGLDGGTTAGTANAQTTTISPTLARGLTVKFTAGFSNTGALTLNGTAVRKGANRDALVSDDVLSGGIYTVYYDGTYYVLMPSDGSAPLPARFLGHKGAYLQDRGVILTYQTNAGVNIHMDGAVSGEPEYFTIEGSCIRLEPLPQQAYNVQLSYYERPVALSSALNDVFRDAPAIYLYASLFELDLYLPNMERAASHFAQFRAALDGYANAMTMATTSSGPFRIRLRNAF